MKINNVFSQLEAEIDSQQAGIPFNNNLQDWNNEKVGQSAESGASAFENNFVM